MESNFDFNKTPLTLPGTKFVVHENPNKMLIQYHNGVHGWYIGPSVEHYWCYKVYISNTKVEHISDIMELFSVNTMIPGISSADAATHVATELIISLKNSAQSTLFVLLVTEKLYALRKLAYIFQGKITENTKLKTCETQTKKVEQNKNRTQPPPKVEPQAVSIPASPTLQTIRKAIPRNPTPPH